MIKRKKFIQIDQKGAEALIVAYLCRPGKFRELFLNNIKSHSFVAGNLFSHYWTETFDTAWPTIVQQPIPVLAKDETFRKFLKHIKKYDKDNLERPYYYIGKKTCHAANYKMMGQTFATDALKESGGRVRLTVGEAQKFLNVYHKLFPEIHLWHVEVEQVFWRAHKENRFPILRNLFGYPRQFTSPYSESLIRKAISFVPQSTVGTITNIGITELQTYIEDSRKSDWDVLQNGHDSILAQCWEENEIELATKMKQVIERELVSPRGEKFRMESEISSGYNWGKYDEKTNPEGLKELIL